MGFITFGRPVVFPGTHTLDNTLKPISFFSWEIAHKKRRTDQLVLGQLLYIQKIISFAKFRALAFAMLS